MPFTNYSHGVTSFGQPILPNTPLTYDSKYYFVDVVNGNDGLDGGTPKNSMKTVEAAYAKLRAGHYDGIFLIGLGTAFPLAAKIAWSKDYTFLIGLTAPIRVAQRARITAGVSTNYLTPMITFSGTGIMVKNVHFYNSGASATLAAVCVLLDGAQRCFFENVHFAGGGSATNSNDASCRSLVIDGGAAAAGQGENLFVNCTIGLDTLPRGNNASVELEVRNFAARNTFENCMFIKAGLAGSLFLTIAASGLLQWIMFKNCTFNNFGTTITNAMSINAAPNGNVLMPGCLFVGMTNIPASAMVFTNPLVSGTSVVLKGMSPA